MVKGCKNWLHFYYNFCSLYKLQICCLLIVSKVGVKLRCWVGLGCRIWSCRICALEVLINSQFDNNRHANKQLILRIRLKKLPEN